MMPFWVLLVFSIALILGITTIKDKPIENLLYLFVGVFLILIATFRVEDECFDYSVYKRLFYENEFNPTVELSFFILKEFLSYFFYSHLSIFFIYAVLGVGLKLYAIRRLTTLRFLSILVYISYVYLNQEVTAMRAGVASSLILLSIEPLYNNKFKSFFGYYILASFFHYSSLICIILWPLRHFATKKGISLIFLGSIFFYFSGIDILFDLPIPYLSNKINMYKELYSAGELGGNINVFRPTMLIKMALFGMLLYKSDIIAASNKYIYILLLYFCIGLSMSLVFAILPVLSFRLSSIFFTVEIVLYPLLYYIFRYDIVSRLVVVALSLISVLITINTIFT